MRSARRFPLQSYLSRIYRLEQLLEMWSQDYERRSSRAKAARWENVFYDRQLVCEEAAAALTEARQALERMPRLS